jgi:pimeloyl-ACP methyl ester carboxylesterase
MRDMTSISQPLVIPGFRSETITMKGVRLHYWIGGDPEGQPVLLWHGFLSTSYEWHKVAPALAQAGVAVLIPDMRGFGDSDKPAGDVGYDNRALAEEFRALVHEIGFGGGRPLILAAHDMGAPPALIWAADHPQEIAGLLYIEGPVMLAEVLQKIIAYTPQAMTKGSMWWWLLPLAPGIPERLVVGNERAFLTWFYAGMTVNIPANAPHFFTNIEGQRARILCMCAPAGQEEFFMGVGTPLKSRTEPAPEQSKDEKAAFMKKAQALAPKYRTELLKP